MAPTVVYVDGFDTGTLGLIVRGVTGWQNMAQHTPETARVPYLTGMTVLAAKETVSPLDLSVQGYMTGATDTALRAALDELKARLHTGADVALRFVDIATREFPVRVLGVDVVGQPPQFIAVNPYYDVTIRAACYDPYLRETTDSTPTFNATADAMALGTAKSFPVLRIDGVATNPVVIYRDSGGTEQARMEFGAYTIASGDYLEIDMRKRTIVQSISSTITDARDELTGGNYFALDPQHGVWWTSAWPTLEVQSGAGTATYRRRYL